jgi:hypothetical protein
MRKASRRQAFHRSDRTCPRALVHTVHDIKVHDVQRAPRDVGRGDGRTFQGSGLACLARKEQAHMSAPIFYVRMMIDRGTLVHWMDIG